MMNCIKNMMVVLILITTLYSCKDIIETDLSEESIAVLGPADNLYTDNLTQTFWWDVVPGATHYNLQIATPQFNNIANLVLDSAVTTELFTYVMSPGTYEWRVRAANSTSATPFETRKLVVSDSLDLSTQIVQLLSPSDNLVTNNLSVTFIWSALSIADGYRIQITEPSFSTYDTLYLDVYTEKLQQTYVFPIEGNYKWRVMGVDTTLVTTTDPSENSITIDTTSPGNPSNLLPLDKETFLSTETFVIDWNRGAETLSGIVTDSLFILQNGASPNMDTVIVLSESSYNVSASLFEVGNYWWFVKSVDAAGNVSSGASIDTSGFTIN